MQKPGWKAGIVAVAVIGLHTVIILLYALPPGLTGNASKPLAPLVYPQFYQNWSLFAPEPPKVDGVITWRFRSPSSPWSDWEPLDENMLDKHQVLRLGHPGRISMAAFNMLDMLVRQRLELEAQGSAGELLMLELKQQYAYYLIRESVRNKARQRAENVAGIEISVDYSLPDSSLYTRRNYRLFFQENYE
jgi:hypothetical protein